MEKIILVGDRGMITTTRITELRKCEGVDWITALRAPAIAKLWPATRTAAARLFDSRTSPRSPPELSPVND